MKIYLGGPMFMEAEVKHNLRLAKKLRSYDFTVYCPNENTSINDKTRTDITGQKVYLADIEQLEDSNVFICQVAEDSGTMWEAGYMNCLSVHVNPSKYYGVIGLATDMRLHTPPNPQKSGVDNQAVGLNQFIVGGMQLSLGIYLDQETMIARLLEIKSDREDNRYNHKKIEDD